MARRVSKRKRPEKEDYVLKERDKVESEVFDKKTLLLLARIMKKGIIDHVEYPVSTGKEANVFRAVAPSGKDIAVKIYRVSTSSFRRKLEYLEGDPRFKKIRKSDYELVKLFARKEFKNLEICKEAGVNSPFPIYLEGNVVVMSFLGRGGVPFPKLSDVDVCSLKSTHQRSLFESMLRMIRRLYDFNLVHADLSEYNILVDVSFTSKNRLVPYFIDFGQGVVLEHPKARRFFVRDISNVVAFFFKKSDVDGNSISKLVEKYFGDVVDVNHILSTVSIPRR